MVQPSNLTDDELELAIDQLAGEAAMGDPAAFEQLQRHREVADERGLFV